MDPSGFGSLASVTVALPTRMARLTGALRVQAEKVQGLDESNSEATLSASDSP
jgi:hypothetical protein